MYELIEEVTTEKQFLEKEIAKWLMSKERDEMLTGERYYRGTHDILKRQRTAIGAGGIKEVIPTLKNNKIIDNRYAKAVTQKSNYLLGKPITTDTDNNGLQQKLNGIFTGKFHNTLRRICTNSLNHGISWLGVFYDGDGELKFKCFNAYEILPFWKNSEHEELDMAVRLFKKEKYVGGRSTYQDFAEVYKKDGIEHYCLKNGRLEPDNSREFFSPYITDGEKTYHWNEIPLIPFKYNSLEIPLIRKVKSLQDALNELLSDFHNNMSEDVHNTILVLKNYEGENLGEFRHNLATYGAVKVRSIDGREGGIETLKIEVNADNYSAIITMLKRAITENAMAYDAKDDRLGGNPNQMNLLSMYSDIELDTNGMESEFQNSLEKLMYFVKMHLESCGADYYGERVDIIFNRDMLMNESEIIDNLVKSKNILSHETIVAQHPWVKNIKLELERVRKETEKSENID